MRGRKGTKLAGRGPTRERFDGSAAPRRPVRGPGRGWARLIIGVGRQAGVRPGDLVGAITNEAKVGGDSVGAIQIADSFSLVEVPEAAADEIVRALRGKTVRGRQVTVRRERPEPPHA